MGRGIIEVPVREVAEFIKDVQNNMSWDNFLIVGVSTYHGSTEIYCIAIAVV